MTLRQQEEHLYDNKTAPGGATHLRQQLLFLEIAALIDEYEGHVDGKVHMFIVTRDRARITHRQSDVHLNYDTTQSPAYEPACEAQKLRAPTLDTDLRDLIAKLLALTDAGDVEGVIRASADLLKAKALANSKKGSS